MPSLLAIVLLIPCAEAVELQQTAAWVRDVYGAELITTGIDYPIRRSTYMIGGENPPPRAAEAYLPVLRRELAKYPPSLLQRTRTRRIILARRLSVNDQPRAAVPDFASMDLILDVELGREAPRYSERVFHHEYYHLIDYLQSGPTLQDGEWERLNLPEFRYGSGGAQMQDNRRNPFAATRSIPGFLSLYGTAAVEEDKAELFSFQLTDGLFVRERAEADSVVRAKVQRLKQQLVRFCPEMDARYFEQLEAGQAAAAALQTARALLTMVNGLTPPCLVLPGGTNLR
jgi:hypothetical protein